MPNFRKACGVLSWLLLGSAPAVGAEFATQPAVKSVVKAAVKQAIVTDKSEAFARIDARGVFKKGARVGTEYVAVLKGGAVFKLLDPNVAPTSPSTPMSPSTPVSPSRSLEQRFPEIFRATPSSVSLARFQTPIRNQGGLSTCWAHAGIAALEAAYKRRTGVELDLSERYLNALGYTSYYSSPHRCKVSNGVTDCSRGRQDFENATSYWDWGGSSNATWPLVVSGVPLEREMPYIPDSRELDALAFRNAPGLLDTTASDWSESTQTDIDDFQYAESYLPMQARKSARYGADETVTLSSLEAPSPGRIQSFIEGNLANNREVTLFVDLRWRANPQTGLMEHDENATRAGHVMLVIGYDRDAQVFTLKNSWGGADYVRVSYDFVFQNFREASFLTGARERPELGRWLGFWYLNDNRLGARIGSGKLVIRRLGCIQGARSDRRPCAANQAEMLGSYYPNSGGVYPVNGYFPPKSNAREIRFWIDTTGARNLPGDLVGVEFSAFLRGDDISSAYLSPSSTVVRMSRNRGFLDALYPPMLSFPQTLLIPAAPEKKLIGK